MPKQKDLKRLVRARMKKTGESYAAARAQLTRKRAPKLAPKLDTTAAGMSDDAVSAKTGRTWPQWIRELTKAGAADLNHRDLARLLRDEYELSGWWAQTVSIGYERITGKREVGQAHDGDFKATKSRTFAVDVESLHKAFARAPMRKKWLGVEGVNVGHSRPPKSARLDWNDGTRVILWFTSKAKNKAQVSIQHEKLTSRAEIERVKAFWHERLNELGRVLAGAG